MVAPVVTLEDVHLRLGESEVLRGVSAQFAEGQSTVIMGPSGCGKSSLLKVAAGLLPPDRGTVRYRGRDVFQMTEGALLAMRRRSGFVFQDAALWENKTLFENLALPLQVHLSDVPAPERRRRVVRALERVGLEASAEQRPSALSGGVRKLASFLRALMIEPALLFMDEPTLSIDHAMTERLHRLIHEQKARGTTIIAVTHDAQLTTTLADRLVVMDAGQIIASGTFDEVKRTPQARVRSILSEVLRDIASYDTDLLSLLDADQR